MAIDAAAARATARSLLHGPAGRPEDQIRQDLVRLLDAMGIDSLMSHLTTSGPADLYLPHRRTIIETKRIRAAENPDTPRSTGETPREQLERYLHAEIRRELGFLDSAGQADRPWTGIVTDGKVWHAWRYQHRPDAVGSEIFRDFRPHTEADLLGKLETLLLSDEPLGKPWIPARPASIFEPFRGQLHDIRASLTGERDARTRTKQELWLNLLRVSSIAPETENQEEQLFVAHSFLIALARGVVHTLATDSRDPDPKQILKDGFPAWIIDSTRGIAWAQDLLDTVHSYEWRRRPGDVLRSVYETFIDARDRKVFGEYYTPDWLAELLVEEVCDEEWCNQSVAAALDAEKRREELSGCGVLDPTCGSGTFLYHAARRLLRCGALQDDTLDPARKASAITSLVCGLDVHPVAVEISRATVLRALPTVPEGAAAAVQVHQGDSLLTQVGQSDSLFTHTADNLRFVTPRGEEIYLPRNFARQRQFATDLARMVNAANQNEPIPPDILATVDKADREALAAGHRQIERIIGDEGNSIWSWYIANITAPVRLAERKVDRIVANPPWVTMSEIQVPERKATLENFANEIGLWHGGRLAPHNDIAKLFVKTCRNKYLADPERNPAAWIVKNTALSGGHWGRFREWHKGHVAQTLDLAKVKPFGPGTARMCCVLFDIRKCSAFGLPARDLVATRSGKVESQMSRAAAVERLAVAAAPVPFPKKRSDYDPDNFRQGATIVPAVLTRIAFVRPAETSRDECWIETIQSAKAPWNIVPVQRGTIPSRWIRRLITSDDLLAFTTRPEFSATIVPVDSKGDLYDNPGESSDLWRECEVLWAEHRSRGKNNPRTLLDRINRQRALSLQLAVGPDRNKSTLLYPSSADIMRAARVSLDSSCTIIDSTTYYWRADTPTEAAYLVALLNAPTLTAAFKAAQESDRHFHTYFWNKIPIPGYNPGDAYHRALARLTVRAEKIADKWISNPENATVLTKKQPAVSRRIRDLLKDKGVLDEVDALAKRILPKHAR